VESCAASIIPDDVRGMSPTVLQQLLPALAAQLAQEQKLECRARALLVVQEIVSLHPSLAVPLALAEGVDACAQDRRLLAQLAHMRVPLEHVMALRTYLRPTS
jgi:hypothetical protein